MEEEHEIYGFDSDDEMEDEDAQLDEQARSRRGEQRRSAGIIGLILPLLRFLVRRRRRPLRRE